MPMENLKNTDFKKLASQKKSIQMKMRYLALSHFQDGQSRASIAKYLKVSRTSVNRWVNAYLTGGIDALNEKPRTGRPHFLTKTQQAILCDFINSHANSQTGGRLIGHDIQCYIKDNFSIDYHADYIYILLAKLGFSWTTSRSRHPKQSDELQENLKKLSFETIMKIPGYMSTDKVDVWFQDEARFGPQNTTTHVWSPVGARPRAVKQQQFEYAYLFGAVCPRDRRSGCSSVD